MCRQGIILLRLSCLAERAEHRNDTGEAAEDGRHEVMPFEAAERERDARERHRQLRPGYHPERSRLSYWHRVPGRQPAVNAEIDSEQVLAQIERSDGGDREANRHCETRVPAGVHECDAKGCEA